LSNKSRAGAAEADGTEFISLTWQAGAFYGTKGGLPPPPPGWQGRARKVFFSEEKKQKTFISGARGKIQAIASVVREAEKQKSFGSFL
jgi:hypothetical protein